MSNDLPDMMPASCCSANVVVTFDVYLQRFQITFKMSLRKQTPSDFLKQIIGRPVVVKLNSGVDYRGNATDISLSLHKCS